MVGGDLNHDVAGFKMDHSAVIEFQSAEVNRIEAMVSARHGFRPTRHKLEIYGLCRECIASGVEVTSQGLSCPIETV